jgi:hypothetical protein
VLPALPLVVAPTASVVLGVTVVFAVVLGGLVVLEVIPVELEGLVVLELMALGLPVVLVAPLAVDPVIPEELVDVPPALALCSSCDTLVLSCAICWRI